MLNNKRHKGKLISGLFLLHSFSAIAEETKPVDPTKRDAFTKIFDYDSTTWLMLLLFLIMALTIFVLYSTLKTLHRHYHPSAVKEEPIISFQRGENEKKESNWTKFDRKFLTRAVPVEREADIMLDHNYDGIRELDNSLPPWWKWGFVFTIVFAVVYLISYHVAGTGKLQLEEYKDELTLAQQLKEERIKIAGENVNEETVIALSDAESISEGKSIFLKNCVTCHLADGGGKVGPNLTDEYWLHGGGIKNIFTTITDGYPAKGMISWKSQLAPKQIQKVASFILTLKGTTPAVAKAPQGDKWVEAAAPATDSTSVASADSTLKK